MYELRQRKPQFSGRRIGRQQELVIRSDAKIMRLNGQSLSGRELEWIRIAVSVMAAGENRD